MNAPDPDLDRMSRYLLGEMPEEEMEALEREYFGRNSLFDELLAAEDDLIDDYVSERLPETERRRFEQGVLPGSGVRDRVQLARALADHAARTQPRPRPWQSLRGPALTLAASLLIAAIAGGSWTYRSGQIGELKALHDALERRQAELSGQVTRLQRLADERQEQIARLSEELTLERLREPVRRIASFVLAPGIERGPAQEGHRLFVPPGIEQVRLRLLLEEDSYPAYRASVETADRREVARGDGLRSKPARAGRAVDVVVPAGLLAPGRYVVMLHGAGGGSPPEPVDAYHFRVAERTLRDRAAP